MEPRHTLGQAPDLLPAKPSFAQANVRGVVLGQPTHLDSPLHRLAGPAQTMHAARVTGDADHAFVHIRRKPPIELDLGITAVATRLQRAEIEKSELHRLFD